MNLLFDTLIGAGAADTPFLERPDGSVIRYGDLDELTGRWANALVELGVQPGDRVAVQVEKSPENLILYLATVRAGVGLIPGG